MLTSTHYHWLPAPLRTLHGGPTEMRLPTRVCWQVLTTDWLPAPLRTGQLDNKGKPARRFTQNASWLWSLDEKATCVFKMLSAIFLHWFTAPEQKAIAMAKILNLLERLLRPRLIWFSWNSCVDEGLLAGTALCICVVDDRPPKPRGESVCIRA